MRYHYSGIDEAGADETGIIEAQTEAAAYQILTARGIRPYALSDGDQNHDRVAWYNRDIRLGAPKTLNFSEQASLSRLFAILMSQKVPLPQILHLLAGSSKNRRTKRHFQRMEQSVASGLTLGEAFASSPEAMAFSPLFMDVVKLADHSDQSETAFLRLAETFQRQHKIRSELRSALVYPAILVLVALAVLGIMVGYLAPTLAPMFSEMGQPVPSGLAGLLAMHRLFLENGAIVWPLLIGVGVGLIFLWVSPSGRRMRDWGLNHLPLLKALRNRAALLAEIETLSLLLHAHIPLTDALERCAQRENPQRHTLFPFQEAAEALRAGRQSATVIGSASELPETLRDLYKLGEQINQLPEFLEGARLALETEFRQQVERAMGLVTPLLTLGLGLGIGGLIYSVMGAILEVNQIAF
jgi:type II secretory pathway component PulF